MTKFWWHSDHGWERGTALLLGIEGKSKFSKSKHHWLAFFITLYHNFCSCNVGPLWPVAFLTHRSMHYNSEPIC